MYGPVTSLVWFFLVWWNIIPDSVLASFPLHIYVHHCWFWWICYDKAKHFTKVVLTIFYLSKWNVKLSINWCKLIIERLFDQCESCTAWFLNCNIYNMIEILFRWLINILKIEKYNTCWRYNLLYNGKFLPHWKDNLVHHSQQSHKVRTNNIELERRIND